jgi:hypothetical protein
MKAHVIMALRTLHADKVAIPLAAFAADIEWRRLAAGVTERPRNAGVTVTVYSISTPHAKKGHPSVVARLFRGHQSQRHKTHLPS